MTVIAIDGIKMRVTLNAMVKVLTPIVGGPFETMNFVINDKGYKTCYVRLSEKIDPVEVIEKICKTRVGMNMYAYIPDEVPELLPSKARSSSGKGKKVHKIPLSLTNESMIANAHGNIMREMQFKFTGLYKLSNKTEHLLLKTIMQEVHERLIEIMHSNESLASNFVLTKFYRKRHPHFGDFQLILSSLHKIQDAEGQPRSQLVESELINSGIRAVGSGDNIPLSKMQSLCSKYSDKIISKVLIHIRKLDLKVNPNNDPMAEAARIKVRKELKNLEPYMSTIIKQVVTQHLTPQNSPSSVVHIYGEPFLPNKEVMIPFTARHRGFSATRSEHMYNLLTMRVDKVNYAGMLAADGTTLVGAKLVIRSAKLPIYKESLPISFERFEKYLSHEQNEQQEENEQNEEYYEEGNAMEQDPEQEWSEQW